MRRAARGSSRNPSRAAAVRTVPPRRVEVDRVDTDAVFADDVEIGQRGEDRRVQRLEASDRLRAAPKKRDERAAIEWPARVVEDRAGIPLEQLGAQRRMSGK